MTARLRLGWRAGWLGRLLRVHSHTAHLLGRCWCRAPGAPVTFYDSQENR